MKKLLLLLCAGVSYVQVSAQASAYLFSESTEAYTAVSGTEATVSGDDASQDLPIGFTFTYCGLPYTTFSLSTNGIIRLGQSIDGGAWDNAAFIDGGQAPLIAAFWDDHNKGTGSIQYATTGTAPNRQLQVGWDQVVVSNGGQNSTTIKGSFKMQLNEADGTIHFWYGAFTGGNYSATIGINQTDNYLNVLPGNPSETSSVQLLSVESVALLTGKKITLTPPAPCSGTPDGGVTVASATGFCFGQAVTFSLDGATDASGITYQWQSSEDGASFTDIDSETNSQFTTFPFTELFYRCAVSCGAETSYSLPEFLGQNPASECYCSPTYDAGKTDGDLISNVIIAGTTLSNNTGTAPENPYYTYFTGQPNYTATLVAGSTYSIQVFNGTYGQQHVAVWIDYNDDAIFAEEERVGYSPEISSLSSATFPIVLGCDVLPGLHRMRVRDVYDTPGDTFDPCANYGWGETEDYDVTVENPVGCAAPSGLAVVSVNSGTAVLSWNQGCNQNAWNVVVLPEEAPFDDSQAYLNVTSPFTVFGLEPDTAYVFYVQGICGEDQESAYSEPFAFTTLPQTVANDDCGTAFTLETGSSFGEFAVTATNSGATKTIGEPAVSCGTFNFGGDVWFTATVPDSGNITIQTGPVADSDIDDTAMAVYSGSCGGGLVALGCNDDSGLSGIEGFSSLTFENRTPGELLYVRVWDYANDQTGSFEVSAFDATLSVGDSFFSSASIYPNPVHGKLNIRLTDAMDAAQVTNLLGQTMPVPFSADFSGADVSLLADGVYLLQLQKDGMVRTLRFIKN